MKHSFYNLNLDKKIGDEESLREQIKRIFEAQKLGPKTFLQTPTRTSKLTEKKLKSILNGRTKYISRDCISEIFELAHNHEQRRLPLDIEILREIKFYMKAGRFGVRTLLKNRSDIIAGITVRKVESWLEGEIARANPDHVKYVHRIAAEKYSERIAIGKGRDIKKEDIRIPLYTSKKKPFNSENRLQLSKKLIKKIYDAVKETSHGPKTFLSGRNDIPEGLTPNLMALWFKGLIKTANPEFIEYIFRVAKERRSEFIQLDHLIDQIRNNMRKTGLGPTKLLKGRTDLPAGLNINTLESWLKGQKIAKREHVLYVLNLQASISKNIPLDQKKNSEEALQNPAIVQSPPVGIDLDVNL